MNPFWKVAHRGWHKVHVENTLEAFRAAYAAGCDLVEFDVQLSRDGVPVVFHDDDCKRLAGKRDFIYDLEWKDIQSIFMPSRARPEPSGKASGLTGYGIPSLEQFLAEFKSKPFYLEMKVPAAVAGNAAYVEMLGEKCASMVKASSPHPDTFLASFHAGILRHVAKHKLFPVLAGIFEDYARFEDVHSGRDAETAAAIRHFSVSWELFRKLIRESAQAAQRIPRSPPRGKPVPEASARRTAGVPGPELFLVWDLKGESEFRAALSHGIRGLVSDDVEAMAKL